MRIFEEENGKLVISPEVKSIKWIKKIIERDRGSKGDHDGRKKLFAIKELLYVYHMADHKSVYRNLPEKVREREIIDSLELPDNWTADLLVREAIDKYRSYKESVSERALKEIKRTLEACIETVQFMREVVEENIEQLREEKDNTKIKSLIEVLKSTLDIGRDIPKSIDEITKLEEKIKKEQGEEGSLRGGGDMNQFEL